MSTGQYDYPILKETTDATSWGVCARCNTPNISERASNCPNCGYGLGAVMSFCEPPSPEKHPKLLDSFSYIIFECSFEDHLPFRMMGDCPVVVTAILLSSQYSATYSEGVLVDVNGPQSEWLHAFGLVPAIGDIILAVDNQIVTQLNSNQLKRYLKRKKVDETNKGRSYRTTIAFRRHYLEVSHF